MIRVLLLVLTSVCGRFAMETAPVFYQMEENDHITVSWDSHTNTDLSLTSLICLSRLDGIKVLYQMVRGLEDPKSVHKQFSRRVLLDRNALKEGRLRLHLFLLTAEDSGDYWCDLIAHYNRKTRKWGIQATVHFILNVTQNICEKIKSSEAVTGAVVLRRQRGSRREVLYKWRREAPV
ncbi:uncharacterized protein LOC114869368 isoform X2 [Betta splendens]|uniref:Uncharacterized protein LOC114869368 isoform X2 n=1 Tax=Betta splendens TaxID=158456 RepID=A0A6P7PR79_BETSP|nr:uncharacterized protein LOC114869368 isoform X2 [Betta splendens]